MLVAGCCYLAKKEIAEIMKLSKKQIRQILTPPVIYIDTKRGEIDVRKEGFIFCSTGIEHKAYIETIIVDSKGTSFKIKSVSPIGRIKLLTSIKYYGPVKEVLPDIFDDVKTISLEDFKILVIHTISKKPRAWSSLDTIENIKENVDKCGSYKEVMKIFNSRLK